MVLGRIGDAAHFGDAKSIKSKESASTLPQKSFGRKSDSGIVLYH